MLRRLVRGVALGAALLLALPMLPAQSRAPQTPTVTGRDSVYDDTTGQLVVTGNARVDYGEVILTAEEIRYHRATNGVVARGNFVLTSGARRLVADEGTYDLNTGRMRVQNLRVGEYPIYIRGALVEGTFEEMVFSDATIFFREDAPYAPSIRAESVTYRSGRLVAARGLQLGVLGAHFIALPQFEHDLRTELISYFMAKVGYRRSLGAFAETNLRIPVALGVRVGADAGYYSERGLLIGPAGAYRRGGEHDFVLGGFSSGYINDHGDKFTDVLGAPVPEERGYIEWWHRQAFGPRMRLNAQFNFWSDSEVVRDFRPKNFFPVQQPDSFLEAVYAGDNFLLSAFARVHPNRYHRVQERLPEVRFDLLPAEVATGVYQRGVASFAVLEEDAFLTAPQQRSRRLDAYYGLEAPLALTPWFTFTSVAGGRFTHYEKTTGVDGRDDYTRTLGEVGFDARLRASGTFDYKNDVWGIDGLRHLLEPRLSYRYAPRADRGRPYIPQIDRRAFSTYLQPLSIADQRNIDELDRLDTLRIALHNTLQTRHPVHGSRELAALNVAADYRFSHRGGRKPLSDIHTELSVTPADWLRVEIYQRFTPQTAVQQELNYAVTITDQEWWSARLGSHFLKGPIGYEEYALDVRRRLNEVFEVAATWRYDMRRNRFNEQTYGLWQRLGQTWAVKYEVSLFEGPRRESSFGFNLEVELLKF